MFELVCVGLENRLSWRFVCVEGIAGLDVWLCFTFGDLEIWLHWFELGWKCGSAALGWRFGFFGDLVELVYIRLCWTLKRFGWDVYLVGLYRRFGWMGYYVMLEIWMSWTFQLVGAWVVFGWFRSVVGLGWPGLEIWLRWRCICIGDYVGLCWTFGCVGYFWVRDMAELDTLLGFTFSWDGW